MVVPVVKAAIGRGKRLLKNLADACRYRLTAGPRQITSPGSVVFVCKGNVCRSAYAEYFMRSAPAPVPLSIASCGLDVKRSDAAPLEARRVAARKGLNLEPHRSRGFEVSDLEGAELILAMEFWQYRQLVMLFPHKKHAIRLLREYAPFPEKPVVQYR